MSSIEFTAQGTTVKDVMDNAEQIARTAFGLAPGDPDITRLEFRYTRMHPVMEVTVADGRTFPQLWQSFVTVIQR